MKLFDFDDELDNILPDTITTSELIATDYHFNYSLYDLHKDWLALRSTREYKNGSQFKPGMKLCQHFCSNFWDIQNSKGLTFRQCWQNYEKMDAIREWGLKSMRHLWMSWIRKAVYMANGLPNSSFYRPHFSRQVIEMTGIENGVLFDPCAGWGGRMLGTTSKDWKYISCEPNGETYKNLQKIIDFTDTRELVTIHNHPVEELDISKLGQVDVVLTSPPYFNLEVYTNEEQQCYNRHNTYAQWRDGWLVPLIDKSLSILNPQGISAWNVMNFGKNDLSGDVIGAHERNGWHLVGTVGFSSPLANIRKLKNKDVTYLFRHKTYSSSSLFDF
jgi:hypothetical protein